jgi:hypothetical protein
MQNQELWGFWQDPTWFGKCQLWSITDAGRCLFMTRYQKHGVNNRQYVEHTERVPSNHKQGILRQVLCTTLHNLYRRCMVATWPQKSKFRYCHLIQWNDIGPFQQRIPSYGRRTNPNKHFFYKMWKTCWKIYSSQLVNQMLLTDPKTILNEHVSMPRGKHVLNLRVLQRDREVL